MRHDRPSSEPDSGATPAIERPHPPVRASEERYLEERAADAADGVVRSVRDIATTLGDLVPLRRYAFEHPWIAASAAIAIGAVAGALLTSSRRQSSGRLAKRSARAAEAEPQSERPAVAPRAVPEILHSIGGAIVTAALPLVLTNWFTPAATAPADGAAGDASEPVDPPAAAEGGID